MAGLLDALFMRSGEDEAAYQARMQAAKDKITKILTFDADKNERALYGLNDPKYSYSERAAVRELEGRKNQGMEPLQKTSFPERAAGGQAYEAQPPAFGLAPALQSQSVQSQGQPEAVQIAKRPYKAPEPTAGQYLSNFAAGYQDGGLIGAIGNAMRTADGDPQKNKTYDFLVSKGLDEDQAQFAVDNPTVLNGILSKMFTPTKRDLQLQEIYDDKGNKRKVLMDMQTGQAQPIGGVFDQGQADFTKKYQETLAQDQAKGRLELPASFEKGSQILSVIQGLENHPALDTATGLSSILDPRNYTPGTSAYDFGTRHAQLQGQSFLQAFESLKGAGQITEIEGRKATEAINRARQAQRKEDYLAALGEIKSIVMTGLARARSRAGMPASGGDQASGLPIRLTDPSQAQSLPSGTRFIDPQGNERIVP